MSIFSGIGNAIKNVVKTVATPYTYTANTVLQEAKGAANWIKNSLGSYAAAVPYLKDQMNYEAQQRKLKYDQQLQQQIFAREDNAATRRAADLRAAGLSPTLAAGSAAGAGGVVATTAPQASGGAEQSTAAIMSMLKMAQDISMSQSQQMLLRQQAGLVQNQADSEVMKQMKYYADILKLNASANKDNWDTQTIVHDLNLARGIGTGTRYHGNSIAHTIKDLVKLWQQTSFNPARDQINKVGKALSDKNIIDNAKGAGAWIWKKYMNFLTK